MFYQQFKDKEIETVVGIESRGFIFAAPLALKLGCRFVLARKPGKLPGETIAEEYDLEYGTDALEVHSDSIKPGDRVLVIDDLLATGGSAKAACQLVDNTGGEVVGVGFLIELNFLNGRSKLDGYDVFSMLQYNEE